MQTIQAIEEAKMTAEVVCTPTKWTHPSGASCKADRMCYHYQHTNPDRKAKNL